MSRTIVVPDIHNQTTAVDAVLDREAYDRVVFLGDYFDGVRDTPETARETAAWLKRRLADPRMLFLYGNHDLPYRFVLPGTVCSGYTAAKRDAISEVLGPEDWSAIRLHAWADGFLLTHAGWHEAFCGSGGAATPHLVDAQCAECLAELEAGRMHPLAAAGGSRGGTASVPGILWQDWSELTAVGGLHQIVGHTPSVEVRRKESESGTAVCLDTRLCHIALIEDGQLSIRTTPVWDEWFGPAGRYPNLFSERR